MNEEEMVEVNKDDCPSTVNVDSEEDGEYVN